MNSHQVTRSPGHWKKCFSFNVARFLTLCLGVLAAWSIAYGLNLDKINVSFTGGDYKSAISEGERILANSHPGSPGLDELYYILGLSYLKDGNYLRASDIFEIIINEFKNTRFKEEAVLGLGDTYFLRGNFDKAGEYYGQILKDYPNAKLKAQVYYRLSQLEFKKGDPQKAKEYADKIKQSFPLNPEIRVNRDIYYAADLYYTVQVGSFSNGDNAKRLGQELTGKGYLAYIEEAFSVDKTVYRVRVGKLNTRQEAEALEKNLAQEGYPAKILP